MAVAGGRSALRVPARASAASGGDSSKCGFSQPELGP